MKILLFGMIILLANCKLCWGQISNRDYKITNIKSNISNHADVERHIDSIAYNNSVSVTRFFYIDSISSYINKPLRILYNNLLMRFDYIDTHYWPNGDGFNFIDSTTIHSGFTIYFKYNDTTLLMIMGNIPYQYGVTLGTINKLNHFLDQKNYELVSFTQPVNKFVEDIEKYITSSRTEDIQELQMIYSAFPTYRKIIAKILKKLE